MNLWLLLEEALAITIVVLLNVAFLTLLERKILGYSQIRVGPNKVGAWGLLQPAADAVKLFSNSITLLGPMNKSVYFFSPVLSLILALLFVPLISPEKGGGFVGLGLIYLFMLLSLNIYPLLGAGWGSGSKFAVLGGLRAVAQTIAYEISLAFLTLSLFTLWASSSVEGVTAPASSSSPLLTLPILFLWVITCVAELNRTPFDFAEGESELVSGFNVEYGSVKFSVIFMAEYGMIYILSVLTSGMFLGAWKHSFASVFTSVVVAGSVVWLRVTLPRFRYDLLMALTWKKILPWSLSACQMACLPSLWF